MSNYVIFLSVLIGLLFFMILISCYINYVEHKELEDKFLKVDKLVGVQYDRITRLGRRTDILVNMIADQNKIIKEHQKIIMLNKDDQLTTTPDLWTIGTHDKCYRREECSCCSEQATWIFNSRPLCDHCLHLLLEVDRYSIKYINYRGIYDKEVE